MICKGTACHVNGSEKVFAAVSEYLGIESGKTTEDGLFTFEKVACLGCCSLAPVIMINGEAFGNLTGAAKGPRPHAGGAGGAAFRIAHRSFQVGIG